MHALPTQPAAVPVDAFRSTGTSPGAFPPASPEDLDPGVVVMKFGSSLLSGGTGYQVAAAEVSAEVERGRRVVAVCSAQRGVTDALVATAAALGPTPPEPLVARLLATGEAASVALLAIAISSRGVAAHTLDVAGLGLRTRGPLLDAEPVGVDTGALRTLLALRPVVVVPGFVGVDASGEPSLLGRGGSDLTALFLAHVLQAGECRLVKDVDGLYSDDPKRSDAAPFVRATWEDVLRLGGCVVQEKAVHFARRHSRAFRIAAPGGRGTWVAAPTEVTPSARSATVVARPEPR